MKEIKISSMNVTQICECFTSMYKACVYLIKQQPEEYLAFKLEENMYQMIISLLGLLKKGIDPSESPYVVVKICESLKASICYLLTQEYNAENRYEKIKYEIAPLIDEAYQNVYYWLWATIDTEKMRQYQLAIPTLCSNHYIDKAEKTGKYKYEIAFIVLAYNKIEYTKICVESLLKNIPTGLSYELILINHGSNDGTKEYFESIHPTKLFNIAVNGGGMGAVSRIIESEFMMMISNDVIITPNAIENLLSCIKSDCKIALAVPSTSNVSNLQAITAIYNSTDELYAFARKNNVLNPFRWEQRCRLCNPIDIRRSAVFYGSQGILPNGYLGAASAQGFPDDRQALLLRRRGYKMMLVKDAYCHHYGSVTIGNKDSRLEQDFYDKGRKAFRSIFGVDPWGTGFCYDTEFQERAVREGQEPLCVLGINCGLGSNSLKIKEQLKEYNHNANVTLLNITDDAAFIEDLQGISNNAQMIEKMDHLEKYVNGKSFDYIVWETPFLISNKFSRILNLLRKHISGAGYFFIKENIQTKKELPLCRAAEHFKGSWWIING